MRLWTRLVSAFLLVVAVLGGITVYIGSRLIADTVLGEAQHRTELDLRSARARIQSRLDQIQSALEHTARSDTARLPLNDDTRRTRQVALERERLHCGLDVLTVCDARGEVVLRSRHPYTQGGNRSLDPVVAKALRGDPASGIVTLHADELAAEGSELPRQAFVSFVDTPHAKPRPERSESSGMMLWAAAPIPGEGGNTLGAVYGGVLLNRNWAIVDGIRNTVFGEQKYQGKELGTVTIFQWDVRVATNVTTAQGNRAIGTRVSEEVYDRVLENGMRWIERAFVVTDWYISSYEPIRNPRGAVIGILYTGILEKKYTDLRNQILRSFITPVGLAIAVSIILSLVVARTIARPLGDLVVASGRLADGDFDYRPHTNTSSPEVAALENAYAQMADAIHQRDQALTQRNTELQQSNEQLTQLNRNYMEMLGFVTHELKSPLSSMIFNAAALRDGYFGTLTDDQKKAAAAITRNANYLSDMIANYLSLSRIEKGEMEVHTQPIDLCGDVVAPMIDQTRAQFDRAKMSLEVHLPDRLDVVADPELLRVVVDNLLSNAAKYGKEGGRVDVEVGESDGEATVSVWNEGEGISEANLPKLFGKFVRLDQPSTKARKGTGLGLFVCREIIEKHGGRIWAESEPGRSARFTFAIPKADAAE